jgi:NADH dehydrogenase FAD-containing subunit
MACASLINSVGDALHIRKQIMDRVEQAELEESPETVDRLLTFAVIGSGQRACATAEETCEMLKTARASYPRPCGNMAGKCTRTRTSRSRSAISRPISSARRDHELAKAGVELCRDREAVAVTPDSVVAQADGERQPVGFVGEQLPIMMPKAVIDGHAGVSPGLATGDRAGFLRLKGRNTSGRPPPWPCRGRDSRVAT